MCNSRAGVDLYSLDITTTFRILVTMGTEIQILRIFQSTFYVLGQKKHFGIVDKMKY